MEQLSLFELSRIIGEALSKNLEPSYWIVAEIGEMRQNQNGHCYLELVEKEDNRIKAKSRATIWSYTYRNLSTWFQGITGQPLKAGMKILCNVTVQYHEVYGFSLNIKDIDAQYTLGERARKKQEIIEQLQKDGIFDLNKELALPTAAQNIAVISSDSAAGFGDFTDQLTQNAYGYQYRIDLYNSIMQGDKAENSIIASMHRIFEKIDDYDLLVIIRGGGASVDLDCFDSYELASHIAQFPIPVITGIGHERDETVADLVAHTKMKTPTATAEFILSGSRDFELTLIEYFNRISRKLSDVADEEYDILINLSNRFQRIAKTVLNEQKLKLNNLQYHLIINQQNMLKVHDRHLTELNQRLAVNPFKITEQAENRLRHLQKELDVIDPKNVLKRGYTVTLVDGQSIQKVKSFKKGAKITTISSDAELESSLLSSKKKN